MLELSADTDARYARRHAECAAEMKKQHQQAAAEIEENDALKKYIDYTEHVLFLQHVEAKISTSIISCESYCRPPDYMPPQTALLVTAQIDEKVFNAVALGPYTISGAEGTAWGILYAIKSAYPV